MSASPPGQTAGSPRQGHIRYGGHSQSSVRAGTVKPISSEELVQDGGEGARAVRIQFLEDVVGHEDGGGPPFGGVIPAGRAQIHWAAVPGGARSGGAVWSGWSRSPGSA